MTDVTKSAQTVKHTLHSRWKTW